MTSLESFIQHSYHTLNGPEKQDRPAEKPGARAWGGGEKAAGSGPRTVGGPPPGGDRRNVSGSLGQWAQSPMLKVMSTALKKSMNIPPTMGMAK